MKALEVVGPALVARRPLRLQRFEAGRTPDPAECVDCLIIINDRNDGQPRAGLALSNGQSWDIIAYLDQAATGSQAPINIAPMVREAVAAQLAHQPTHPVANVIQGVPAIEVKDTHDLQAIATAMLELAEQNTALQRRVWELEQRFDSLDRVEVPIGIERVG